MAKGIIAQLVVAVTSQGAGKVRKETEQLVNSTNKVGDAHAAANKSARDHFNTQDKGIIGTANSTRSFSKLAQTMNGGGSSSVVGAYATLMANVFALTAAFNALKSAAAMQQIEKGLEALGTRTGQTLSIAAKGLKEITGNAISTEQALRSSAQVFSAGFGREELERLGKVANDASFALGRNMTDSMDRLTRGVIKLEPELLDELGIMTRLGEATKAYALELNKSESALTTSERRQAFFNAVMTEGELKFGGLAEAAGNTKAFDQLSSSLADVTKQTMNLLNKAALPLAAVFSTSPAALIGGAVLFASTIKDQLLPGLTDLSRRSTKAAEELEKLAKKEIKDIMGIENNPAVLESLQDKIKEGTASLTDYKKSYADVNEEIKRHNVLLEKYEKRKTNTKRQTEEYEKNIRAISDLRDSQQELNDVILATERVYTQRSAASAIELAGNYKLTESLDAIREAKAGYKKELIASQKVQQVTATGLTNIRTAAFGASIGVRALGAAFLNAIPIIGQVVFVAGLLFAAFKALESKETKALKSALKDLDTVVGGLNAKMEHLVTISESNASQASKAVESIRLQTKATIEFAESIDRVRIARERRDQAEKENPGDKTSVTGNKNSTYRALGLDWGVLSEFTTKGKEAINAYKGLEAIDPQGLKELINSTKNWNTLSLVERTKILEDRIAKLGKAAKTASGEFEALVTTQKAAGDAVGAFSRSSLATTPFDAAVSSLQAYNNAIKESTVLADTAANGNAEFLSVIQNVPESIKSLMSVDVSNLVDDLKTAYTIGQKAVEERTAYETRALKAAQTRMGLGKATVDQLMKEQEAIQANFETAQRSVILAQSENALLGARLKAAQANNALTAEGLRRQLEAENKTIENSATALRQQKLLLSQQSLQTSAKIEALKVDLETNKLKEQELSTSRALTRQEQVRAQLAKIRERDNFGRDTEEWKNRNEQAKEMLRTIAKIDAEETQARENLAANTLTSLSSINTLTQQRANFENQILATQNELSALLLGLNSQENINAQFKQKQLELDRARLSTLMTIRDTLSTASQNEEQLAILRDRGRISMMDEIRLARERTAQSRYRVLSDSKAEKEKLQADLAVARTRAGAEKDTIKYYEDAIQLAEYKEQADLAAIDSAARLEELSKGIFDKYKEGLEWQQQSLQLIERQISAQSELLTSVNNRVRAEEAFERKRKGYGDKTRLGNQSDEIRNASQALEIAKQEASVKKAMIDLEFALLEAQQIQISEEMRARRALLASQNSDGAFTQHIAQLDRVVDTISKANFQGMAAASKAAVDEGVKTAEANLRAASITSIVGINGAARDYLDRQKALSEANRVLNAPQAAAIAAPVIASAMETKVVDPIVDSQNLLNSSLVDLTNTIGSLIEALTSIPIETAKSAREMIVQAGQYAQQKGYRVSEHPDFGGIKGEHRGRGHAEGRAIDVNVGYGNREWDNPRMKAQFDRFKAEMEALGATVLWGVKGHYDHMHIEFKEGLVNHAQILETISRTLPTETATAVASAVEETATRVADVIVTAVKPEILTAANDNTLTPISAHMPSVVSDPSKIQIATDAMQLLNDQARDLKSIFAELGPQGQVMIAAIEGVSTFGATLEHAMNVFKDNDATMADKFSAVGAAASTALATVQQMNRAAADAKIENIDREIAAEQKRDGKSAESIAKIEALERKKDAINRKAFDTNKKIMMAQSIIATATGVAQSLTLPFPLNVAMAAMIGALGAAQLAIISGTSYQSTSAPAQQAAMPSTLTIGKQGDRVDLAKNNSNAGGEIGYLRGARGQGRSAADYAVIGSAYGGNLPRGYGNTGYLVGEHGPEIIKPEVPTTVVPANDNSNQAPVNATFNIHALDASGVQDILHAQRGFIIGSIREAANANGQGFLEDVNTNVYTKPNVGRL